MTADFGLSWIPSLNCYRLLLGDQGRKDGNPFIMEYYFPAKHGGKRKAAQYARQRRDELLKTPRFEEYFRYRINGRRVPRTRATSSVAFSGVSFVKGLTRRNGKVYVSPRFRVYWSDELLASYSLKAQGAYHALREAVYCRAEKEGREVAAQEFEAIYRKWRRNKSVSEFLLLHDIPSR